MSLELFGRSISMQEELQHNVFLRCSEPALAQSTGTDPGLNTLAELRRRKDGWTWADSFMTFALYIIQMIPAASSYLGLNH